jgi:hypothetical protein
MLPVEPMGDAPETNGPSPLLQQAQGFVNVAHEVNNECVKGEEAEKEMKARKNESGQ